MWKRSFIFLLVSLAVVFSLSAYPAFFYGGAKEAPTVVEEVQETSTEESEKLTQDLISSKEESAPEVSDRSEVWSDTKSVLELLEEAKAQISVEKENALRDIRSTVAELSVQIAEKVVRRELKNDGEQEKLIQRMLDEVLTSK